MQNPYTPPAVPISNTTSVPAKPDFHRHRLGLLIAYSILTGVLALFAMGAYWVIDSFTEVFKSFGAELPGLTLFVIKSVPYWGILPLCSALITLGIWLHKRCTRRFITAAWTVFVLFTILTLALLPITVVGLYQPIYSLGSVV